MESQDRRDVAGDRAVTQIHQQHGKKNAHQPENLSKSEGLSVKTGGKGPTHINWKTLSSVVITCRGLKKNGPHRLIDLRAWSPGSGTIRRHHLVVGDVALL